ncbi:sodium/potassium/calcium exchanger 2-like [Tubulanus polymorphus]|uniref:sodium/potassium/calcium exchanger 2-like n=1 Tax=Tubulanus polymorphus TaxID=672921 RepID=UPI003DA4C053
MFWKKRRGWMKTCGHRKEQIERYRSHGWIFLCSMCLLIGFLHQNYLKENSNAIAIVCDDFFVPSLEVISEKLNLSEDVAGATFMAAGSSAPELFASVAGVAVETDVGVGTIVGSAVFNILIIIALTAALAGQVLLLDWRPMTRDAVFYGLSIACFIGFSWDNKFEWYESTILLVLYALYIVIMVINRRVMEWMNKWKNCCRPRIAPEEAAVENVEEPASLATEEIAEKERQTKMMSMAGGHARRLSIISHRASLSDSSQDKHIFHHNKRGSIGASIGVRSSTQVHHPHFTPGNEAITEDELESEESSPPNHKDAKDDIENDNHDSGGEEEEEVEGMKCGCLVIKASSPKLDDAKKEGGCWAWTKFVLRWIVFVVSFPFVLLFSITIPDCSSEKNRKFFALSFIMAVLWIAVISFGLVTLVGRTGCILGVGQYTMGVLVIAVGTSIPDALSSVLVARDGYGDMAVSNAIGSNVFDINLGLGLPFIIRTIINRGKPIYLLNDELTIHHTHINHNIDAGYA